jgi:hypothetical protein
MEQLMNYNQRELLRFFQQFRLKYDPTPANKARRVYGDTILRAGQQSSAVSHKALLS